MPKLNPYFAYGSNLNAKRFESRCPNSRFVRKAVLFNYEFIIASRGFASVIPSPGGRVEGALYKLTKADEKNLDKWEGVDKGLYRKENHPVKVGAKPITALVYIDNDPRPGVASEDYCEIILKGAADRKLSKAYQKKLLAIMTR